MGGARTTRGTPRRRIMGGDPDDAGGTQTKNNMGNTQTLSRGTPRRSVAPTRATARAFLCVVTQPYRFLLFSHRLQRDLGFKEGHAWQWWTVRPPLGQWWARGACTIEWRRKMCGWGGGRAMGCGICALLWRLVWRGTCTADAFWADRGGITLHSRLSLRGTHNLADNSLLNQK